MIGYFIYIVFLYYHGRYGLFHDLNQSIHQSYEENDIKSMTSSVNLVNKWTE